MLTDLPFLCPETPLKGQGQMQPPLPLVGEAIEQKGMRAGTWHAEPIAPATATPGTSAPVVLGCYSLRLWSWRPPQPTVAPMRAGGRKQTHRFFMRLFIYFEWQSTDCGSSTLLVNESLRGLVI